jgi:hypothetical protein
MACRSCGGARQDGPPDPNRGLTGSWSVRWPHGALQKFSSEQAARQFVDGQRASLRDAFAVLPPASDTSDQ